MPRGGGKVGCGAIIEDRTVARGLRHRGLAAMRADVERSCCGLREGPASSSGAEFGTLLSTKGWGGRGRGGGGEEWHPASRGALVAGDLDASSHRSR